MEAYINILKNKFKTAFAYRFDYFIGLFGAIVKIFLQYYIWKALLGNTVRSTSSGNVDFKNMVTYLFVSSFLQTFQTVEFITIFNERIKIGQIAMDIIKPLNLKLMWFCESVGENVFKGIFQMTPIAIFSFIIIGIQMPTAMNLILFLISSLNGMLLLFLFIYVCGMTGFWIQQIWVLRLFILDTIGIFSGSVIPLWFFPKIFAEISNYLPFQFIYYTPISIYMGNFSFNDAIILIIKQLIWIFVFYATGRLLWSRGTKKLVIQGG